MGFNWGSTVPTCEKAKEWLATYENGYGKQYSDWQEIVDDLKATVDRLCITAPPPPSGTGTNNNALIIVAGLAIAYFLLKGKLK